MAESGNCSTSWHQTAKNCVSIMSWSGGTRHLKKFKSVADSKQAFKTLWAKSYKIFPTIKEAIRYTGNDRAQNWLDIVTKEYYN